MAVKFPLDFPGFINSQQALALLRDLGQPRSIAKGGSLAMEGDGAEGFWWVEQGAVRIDQISLDGRQLELGRFSSGEIVAAALAFADAPFPHHLEAMVDSRLLWFPRRLAWQHITTTPELAAFFLLMLAGKCRLLQQRLHTQGLQTLRERLLIHLRGLAASTDAGSFQLSQTKKELAKELGATPETLSRTLRVLIDEGMLSMQGRRLCLLK